MKFIADLGRLALLSICFSLPLPAQDAVRLHVQPLDFQQKSDGEFLYFDIINQIEWADHKLYLSGMTTPYVAELDEKGRVLTFIGGLGQGPGEFGGGILALSIYDDGLWAQDAGRRDQYQYFSSGRYIRSLKPDSQQIRLVSGNSNVFGHNHEFVVIPCHPRTGYLAIAHGVNDSRPVGEILFTRENDMDLLRRIPAMNDTLWRFQNGFWYALFKFHPLLIKFDQNFKQIGSLHLESKFIDGKATEIIDFVPDEKKKFVARLFPDFKVTKRHVFVFCQSYLHQFDIEDGSLTGLFSFHGDDPSLPRDLPRLGFSPFAVTEAGRVFLVGNSNWGHDLWIADLSDNL